MSYEKKKELNRLIRQAEDVKRMIRSVCKAQDEYSKFEEQYYEIQKDLEELYQESDHIAERISELEKDIDSGEP